jgi:hypothetical protein
MNELESEARKLRNLIYIDFHGEISDDKWKNMKDNWINDLGWLREKAKQPLKLFGDIKTEVTEVTEVKTEKKSEKPKSNIIEKVI